MIQKNEKIQRFSFEMILENIVKVAFWFSLALVFVLFILVFGENKRFLIFHKILPCYLTFLLS